MPDLSRMNSPGSKTVAGSGRTNRTSSREARQELRTGRQRGSIISRRLLSTGTRRTRGGASSSGTLILDLSSCRSSTMPSRRRWSPLRMPSVARAVFRRLVAVGFRKSRSTILSGRVVRTRSTSGAHPSWAYSPWTSTYHRCVSRLSIRVSSTLMPSSCSAARKDRWRLRHATRGSGPYWQPKEYNCSSGVTTCRSPPRTSIKSSRGQDRYGKTTTGVGPCVLIFDVQIAALCREHGIDTILTNDRNFGRFEPLRVHRLS